MIAYDVEISTEVPITVKALEPKVIDVYVICLSDCNANSFLHFWIEGVHIKHNDCLRSAIKTKLYHRHMILESTVFKCTQICNTACNLNFSFIFCHRMFLFCTMIAYVVQIATYVSVHQCVLGVKVKVKYT